MDDTDETVSDDAELLDWFSTRTWWDLSIALSMAMNANVEFPDREDDPDVSPGDPFTLRVYETGSTVEYPLTIRKFLVTALSTYDEADCVHTWQDLEDEVEAVERIQVSIGRKPFAPWQEWDDFLATEYPYRKASAGTWTVARWRDQRLAPQLPTHAVIELSYPDGSPVAGQTRLSTLRRAWANEPARSRPAPTDPDRLFEVMRDTRWIGYVLTATT